MSRSSRSRSRKSSSRGGGGGGRSSSSSSSSSRVVVVVAVAVVVVVGFCVTSRVFIIVYTVFVVCTVIDVYTLWSLLALALQSWGPVLVSLDVKGLLV